MKSVNTVYEKCLFSTLDMAKDRSNSTRHVSGYFGRHAHSGGLLFLFYCITFSLHQFQNMINTTTNSTPHAFRKICAPWGVIFFLGASNEIY